jgi:hypothetical protein
MNCCRGSKPNDAKPHLNIQNVNHVLKEKLKPPFACRFGAKRGGCDYYTALA